jgi:hypothetical protein
LQQGEKLNLEGAQLGSLDDRVESSLAKLAGGQTRHRSHGAALALRFLFFGT